MTGREWAYPYFFGDKKKGHPVAGSTRELHSSQPNFMWPNGPRHYTDERTEVHDHIIKRSLKGARSMEHPFAVIIAGGPTSGKSTLITALRKVGILPHDGVVTINKMPFAQLPEFHQYSNARHPEKVMTLVDEYYDLMHYIIEAASEKKYPLIIEDHCESAYSVRKTVKHLREAGYEVAMIGMTTDVESYFHHENKRCEKEHKIPDHPWALKLHGGLAMNWDEYARLCDISLLCKRNAEGPPISIIAKSKRTGKGSYKHEIIDKEFYNNVFKTWPFVKLDAKEPKDAFRWGYHGKRPESEQGGLGGSGKRSSRGREETAEENQTAVETTSTPTTEQPGKRERRKKTEEVAPIQIDPSLSFVQKLELFSNETSKGPKK